MNNFQGELFTESSFVAQRSEWHLVTRHVLLAAVSGRGRGGPSGEVLRPANGEARIDILFEEAPASARSGDNTHAE